MNSFKKLLTYCVTVCMLVSLFTVANASAQMSDGNTASHNYGRIKSDIVLNKSSAPAETPRMGTLPSSYDSRTYGYITSVKNQGNYGSCWSFSALNACEASLIKNNGYGINDLDLAETHLCYAAFTGAYDALGLLSGDKTTLSSQYRPYGAIDVGGDMYKASMTLARWEGVVDEVDNPEYAYSKASRTYTFTGKTEKAYSLNKAQLTDALWIAANDRDTVKSMVMEYGAGDFGYFHDSYDIYQEGLYYSSEYSSYCFIQSVSPDDNDFEFPNHEVSIVGWDDNFPKEYFTKYSRPKSNGAWLCKNSWGEDWGNDGYFWLSYEDSSIQQEYVAFYKLNSVGTFDNNYQYDGTLNATTVYPTGSNGGYMANVFTAQSDETLEAVSFFTYDENLKYSVDIYTGVSSSGPTSGKKAGSSVSGTMEHCGYHTVMLPNPVAVKKGVSFSVVVRLYSASGDKINLPCDQSLDEGWIYYTNSASDGQSYYSSSGSTWTDVSKSTKTNFRVKAFTTNGIDSSLDTDTSGENSDSDNYYINDDLRSKSAMRIDEAQNETDGTQVTVIGQVVYKYGLATNGKYKNIIIQDLKNNEPIGILLYDGTGNYNPENGLIVEVTGELSTFEGLREIKKITDIIIKEEDVELIAPQKLSLSELLANPDSYLNETVYLSGVSVIKNSSGKVQIKQDGKTIEIYDAITCPDDIDSEDIIDLKCVFSVYNGTYQLRVCSEEDYIYLTFDNNSTDSEPDTDTSTPTDSESDKEGASDGSDSDTDMSDIMLYRKGDVTGDGEITMEDVVAVQKHIAKLKNLTGNVLNAADVNNDGKVTMLDVTSMQRYIARLIESFRELKTFARTESVVRAELPL